MSSVVPPGGARTLHKRAAKQKALKNSAENSKKQQNKSLTSAQLDGSTNNILKLFSTGSLKNSVNIKNEGDGFKVQPVAIIVLALAFVLTVISLHLLNKFVLFYF
ncbi:hypothetical protein ACO0R3_002070 [Hanseniaspora guilliermondii]